MAGKVHVLHGEDEFSAKEALERLKAALGPPDAVSPNTTVFEGHSLAYGQLEMACHTVPFLADYRLVVVEGLFERFEERAAPARAGRRPAAAKPAAKGEDDWGRLPAMVQAMPPTTTLVLVSGKVNAKNPVLAALSPLAQVQEFPVLKGSQLQAWVKERAEQLGGTMSGEAQRMLADFVGGNLRQLDSEIRKLCLFAGSRNIDDAMVRALVGDTREASIFVLVDALVEGRRADAIRTLRQLMDQGEAAPRIIANLATQVRRMVQAQSLTSAGADQFEMMRAMGTGSDYAVKKARQQARRYQTEDLMAMYQRLLDTDLGIKTGAMPEDPDLRMELLVLELSAPRL